MATKSPVKSTTDRGDLKLTWSSVTENDTFEAYELPGIPQEISVSAYGTFGSASIAVNGGHVSGQLVSTSDMSDTTIAMSAAGLVSVLQRPTIVQPVATGGSSQSLNVVMVVRI